jgi:hypothetical protein
VQTAVSKIAVTCPGCLARFEVSDKYAGKKGPCPKCKKEIVVPDKAEQVVIHAPPDAIPKDSKGVSVLKPISRPDFKVGKLTLGLIIGSIVFVIAGAGWVRWTMDAAPLSLLVLGAILLAPPAIMFGYTFLHDDELEGYSGKEYFVRTLICSIVFAATWLFYWQVGLYLDNKTLAQISGGQMAFLMACMVGIGTGTALACFELEVTQAVIQYLGYFALTFALAWFLKVELAEPLATPKASQYPAIQKPLR